MKQKQMPKPTLMRRFMKLVCGMLAVVLALLAGVTAYFQYLIDKGAIAPEEALPVLSEMVEEGLDGLGADWQASPLGATGQEGRVNILLIGQDRSEAVKGSRSDTMILCTFDKENSKLILTSFLRDLYLPIPGYGSNRINAAYAFGGRKLLAQTVEKNFEVAVDGCVEADFTRFPRIIDLLGGVEIDLRADEAALISKDTGQSVEKGVQRLNGQQALCYARIRKLDGEGDFGRTSRQRKVMEALMRSYREIDVKTMLSLLRELLPMVETDLNLLEITKYAVELLPLLSSGETVSQRIPADGAYTYRTIDGMSVLVPDMEKARKQLHDTVGT